ncbi:hypothetical protein JZ751_003440 [Albula glossodonta]|uniref:Uncharacterized protein n=1 Tax=Albula glossodonta TaxID=121402 RepID=A0A8T2NB14_9TELE|nr:hypothetical protein JZ751_003440 [Albula glossodonta]
MYAQAAPSVRGGKMMEAVNGETERAVFYILHSQGAALHRQIERVPELQTGGTRAPVSLQLSPTAAAFHRLSFCFSLQRTG